MSRAGERRPSVSIPYAGACYPLGSEWAFDQREGHLRIDTLVLQCVVFVGIAPNGRPFTPYGTAFLVCSRYDGEAFQTLVTARHVIEDIDGDTVWIRINSISGGVMVLPTEKAMWRYHDDRNIDLAACPTVFHAEQFAVKHLDITTNIVLTEATKQQENIGVGDDVATVGLFVPRTGENRNIPIVRSGTIAAMNDEKISTHHGTFDAYLIDSTSLDGLSGSPVFVQLPPLRVTGQFVQPSIHSLYLLGVNIGHHATSNPRDVVLIGDDANSAIDVTPIISTGISVVVPIKYVHQLVEHPEFVAGRRDLLARKRAASGFVCDGG